MDRDLFGLKIPAIVGSQSAAITSSADRSLHELFEVSHKILAWLLALLLIVHVAGALRHHLGKRNDILRRMTWGARAS
jgi:cytochrome b561